jgi:hypothetical protein
MLLIQAASGSPSNVLHLTMTVDDSAGVEVACEP